MGVTPRHRIDPDARPYDPASIPARPDVAPDVFFSLDLRVGRILEVIEFPEARDPAYKLHIDLGSVLGTRRSSAKITNYARGELVGRRVVVAVNLGSRRIAGFVSECLVMGALRPDGTVCLLDVDGDAAPGSVIA